MAVEYRDRAPRCAHGFLARLCQVARCDFADKIQTRAVGTERTPLERRRFQEAARAAARERLARGKGGRA